MKRVDEQHLRRRVQQHAGCRLGPQLDHRRCRESSRRVRATAAATRLPAGRFASSARRPARRVAMASWLSSRARSGSARCPVHGASRFAARDDASADFSEAVQAASGSRPHGPDRFTPATRWCPSPALRAESTLAHPRAGVWTLRAAPGSPAITSVKQAKPAPQPKLTVTREAEAGRLERARARPATGRPPAARTFRCTPRTAPSTYLRARPPGAPPAPVRPGAHG